MDQKPQTQKRTLMPPKSQNNDMNKIPLKTDFQALTATDSPHDSQADDHKIRLHVEGMDCGACGLKIEKALGSLNHVRDVKVSLAAKSVHVSYEGPPQGEEAIRILKRLGFTATRQETAQTQQETIEQTPSLPFWRQRSGLLLLATGGALLLSQSLGILSDVAGHIALWGALAIGFVPIAWRAVTAARYGTIFSIQMLMTLAAIAAITIGAEEEAAMVLFLFLIGELLEEIAAGKARAGIHSLSTLMPQTALREVVTASSQEKTTEQIATSQLVVGDILHIRPGDRIPADGVVLTGIGSVDDSPLTGESLPKAKAPGDPVHAGTINCESLLRIEMTAEAHNTMMARIVRLVEDAREQKAPTARFIDRFAHFYTPCIVLFALAVAIIPPLMAGENWSEWVYRAATLLLIGCPCALVLSTPTAIAAGLAVGTKRGLLMKGGAVIETLARTSLVAFDKTGTLTEGAPKVQTILPLHMEDEDQILALAAALSQAANHPLGRAILLEAQNRSTAHATATNLHVRAGKGVAGDIAGVPYFFGSLTAIASGENFQTLEKTAATLQSAGETLSVLTRDGRPIGLVAFTDRLKPDAAHGIAALHHRNIDCKMLTGDHHIAAESVAKRLNIPAHADLLPEAKMQHIRAAQEHGHVVVKVGDGINDAPALAAADVGIAMGSGTEVALETADAAVLHGRVQDVADMITLSRRTLYIIYQNIVLALGLKLFFLVTTLSGVTGLWPAVLADTGATVLVTLNALRLLRLRL